MRNILICVCIVLFVLIANVYADDSRIDISTFENSMKDHAKYHENAWEYWGLTQQEWARYESIKQKSPWGTWKNEASPLAILAHYSSSTSEKSRYAHLQAELDQWRENITFEWQMIYNKEREIVFSKNAALIGNRKPLVGNIKPSDRILFFALAGECNTRCRAVTNRLMATSAHIDIFVIGAKIEKDIVSWATSAKIPVERVNAKQITLNYENNYLPAVTTTPKQLIEFPVAYWQAKDEYKMVVF